MTEFDESAFARTVAEAVSRKLDDDAIKMFNGEAIESLRGSREQQESHWAGILRGARLRRVLRYAAGYVKDSLLMRYYDSMTEAGEYGSDN